jgi:hypothetical protein
MNVFILHNGQKIIEPNLEPKSLLEVLQLDATSALLTRAKELSLTAVTMAVLEYESDVLRFWVFADGALQIEYDSSPTFATCTISPPEGSKLEHLAALFGVSEASKAVVQLLKRKRGYGFLNEQQRLEQLLSLLGLANA